MQFKCYDAFLNKSIENEIFENKVKLWEQIELFGDFHGIYYFCYIVFQNTLFYFERQNISIHPCFASRQPLKPSNEY